MPEQLFRIMRKGPYMRIGTAEEQRGGMQRAFDQNLWQGNFACSVRKTLKAELVNVRRSGAGASVGKGADTYCRRAIKT